MQIHVIGSFVFIFSWIACLFQFFYLQRYSRETNRRGLAAGETARNILDAHGLAQAVVDYTAPERMTRGSQVKKLYLPKRIYESASLYAAARAGHETVIMIESPVSYLPLKQKWAVTGWTSVAAWVSMIAAFYAPLAYLGYLSSFLFTAAFLSAIFFVPREWETAEKANEFLRMTECFEVDELMKIKNILRGIRLESLALIFKAPFKLIGAMMGKNDGF